MKYILIFAFIIGAGYGVIYILEQREMSDSAIQNTTLVRDPDSVIAYVSTNISDLSPEKEVLGGTFYVTNITVDEGTGSVEYEDGHNAFVANFMYEYEEDGEVVITSFVIADDE